MLEHEDVVFEEQRTLASVMDTEVTKDTVYPEPNPDQLVAVHDSLNKLNDIHNTVSTEGISTYEIQALKSIRSDLMKSGVVLEETTSLENYEYLFSETRSHLNKEISLESIKETIVKTIKAWIAKLIDLLAATLQWIKSMMVSWELTRGNLDKYNQSIGKLSDNFIKLYNIDPRSRARVDPQLKELALALLKEPALNRCMAGLTAFGKDRKLTTRQRIVFNDITHRSVHFAEFVTAATPWAKAARLYPQIFADASMVTSAVAVKR